MLCYQKILKSLTSLKKTIMIALLCLLFISSQPFIYGESDKKKIHEMTLEELMEVKISVASKTTMTQYESPGIISIITADEIKNSGASDLKDILRLVPGFEFSMDVTAAVGISLRGNLGYIGRVLIMIDGQELNELFYACTFIGNHYPVSNIKRIEIIRGPGSSIYGGFAELGVINIITKSGNDINGIEVSMDYGQMSKTYSHKNITISGGQKINDLEYAFNAFWGDGNRSSRDNFDIYGDSFSMAGQSDLDPKFFNINLKYKEFSARIIYDKYITRSRDYFGINLSKAYQIDYESILGEIKYNWKILNNFTITTKYNFVSTVPWHSIETPISEDEDLKLDFDKSAIRNKFNLTGIYNLNKNINLLTGFEYYRDKAKHNKGFSHDHFWDGKKEISYYNISGFIQAIFKLKFVNMTIGARLDSHNHFGSAFAPRIAITKSFDKFHLKLLYSRAFRTPSIDELDLNYYLLPSDKFEPELKPEHASVLEAEVGYKISSDMFLTLNFFYSNVSDSIVFTYSDASEEGGEGYDNRGASGTKGFEIEYRYKHDWGYITLNYSYYNSKGINEVAYYAPRDNKSKLLGTSPHKFTLNGSYKISKGFTINPSFVFLGKRYAYTRYDKEIDGMTLTHQDPVFLTNLYLNFNDAFINNLNIGLGVYNILDSDYNFIQPYNGSHPPLPGQGRELIIKFNYKFNY